MKGTNSREGDKKTLVDRHGFDAVMKGLVSVPKNGTIAEHPKRRRRKAKKKLTP